MGDETRPQEECTCGKEPGCRQHPPAHLQDMRHCLGPRCWIKDAESCACRFCEGCNAVRAERELAEMATVAVGAVNAVREREATEPGAAVFSLEAEREKRKPASAEDDVQRILRQHKRLQHVIAALAKKAGRIRISADDLRDVGDHPRFRMRMDDGGNVIITWEK